jgi:hypothetical protein
MSDGSLDLAKVVGMIMENPALIEQISAMVKGKSGAEDTVDTTAPQSVSREEAPVTEAVSAAATYQGQGNRRSNRGRLLGSLKPYLSESRATAIDTMISIADVLDVMKRR